MIMLEFIRSSNLGEITFHGVPFLMKRSLLGILLLSCITPLVAIY
jgi:hypothetical protein